MEVRLYSQGIRDRITGNSLNGRFRLKIRKTFFTKMIVKHWNKLPREVVEPPSLQIFKRWVDDMGTWFNGGLGIAGLMALLD